MGRGRKASRLVMVILVSSFCISAMTWSRGFSLEPAGLQVIEPNGDNDRIGAASDYATDVWADAWDMNQPSDTYRTRGFTNEMFENGLFSGLTSSNDAYFWLLHQGYPNAHNAGKTGLVAPIVAATYRQLTFRMYRDLDNANIPVRVYWYKAGDEVTGRPCGVTQPLAPVAGWHVYRVDLSDPASWGPSRTCDWSGDVTGLRIDPTSTSNTSIRNVKVKVDWVRLTDPDTETPYTVRWDMDGGAIALDLDGNGDPGDGTLMPIAAGLDASARAYTWPGGGLPPGVYYVQARSGLDYAGVVRDDAWDFLQAGDVEATFNMGSVSYNGSVLTFASTSNDPYFFLDIPSDALIDGTRFRRAAIRMNSAATGAGAYMYLYWRCAGETDWNQSVVLPTQTGWNVYSLDLSNPGNVAQGHWCGAEAVTEFRVDATTASNVQISVDWIALTTGAIPAQESDLLPLTATSPGPLTINHDPVCKITAPSMTAGEDYATAVLGNAWDMSHLEDIERLEGIATYQFLNGIFHATTAAVSSGWGDPQLWLHTGDDQSRYIDTDKYHYLTWRYWQEGVQDVGNGWVMRYLWTPTNFPDQTSTLNDVITLDGWPAFTEDAGWHTYSVDLKKASLEPGSPGWWGQQRLFRFDPTEAPASQRIHLDYILLTADAEADSHYNIEWDCWDPDGDELIMTLYFDNNQEGFNGLPITTLSTLPSTGGSGEPAALPQPETVQATWPYTVYLPSIRGGSGAAPCAEQCYTWTTSDVPEGTYYVHATVDDGYNVTQMYSEAPVIVDHSP